MSHQCGYRSAGFSDSAFAGTCCYQAVKPDLIGCAQVGLAVRGIYGEGSETTGNLVQISNQVTLGQSAEEIVSNLFGVTRQIVEQENRSDKYC